MNDMSTPAGIGHNGGPLIDPEVMTEMNDTVQRFADGVKKWVKLKKIETEDQAGKLVDFVSGARTARSNFEAIRKTGKQPIIDAGKEFDAIFKKLNAALDKSIALVTPMQTDYLERKQIEQDKLAEEQTRIAEQQKRDAALLAAEAESQGDVMKMAEAEEAQKAAADAGKVAERTKTAAVNVKSVTGGGRTMSARAQRSAKATNINVLFLHYRENPKVVALLEQLATADVRAKGVDETKIPGIEIITTRSAA